MFYVDLEGAVRSGFDVFDGIDLPSTVTDYEELYDIATSKFRRKVQRLFALSGQNVLIIDHLQIAAEYTGNRLGLALVDRCIQQYGHGCSLVCLRCYALQFEAPGKRLRTDEAWNRRLELYRFRDDLAHSKRKLRRYFSQVGFRSLPGTDLLLINIEGPPANFAKVLTADETVRPQVTGA